MAWKDARQGERGRANAILALGLDELKDVRSDREQLQTDGHAIASSDCSRCSDHRVNPGAGKLAEIADLHLIVANERRKNLRILG